MKIRRNILRLALVISLTFASLIVWAQQSLQENAPKGQVISVENWPGPNNSKPAVKLKLRLSDEQVIQLKVTSDSLKNPIPQQGEKVTVVGFQWDLYKSKKPVEVIPTQKANRAWELKVKD